MPRSDIQFQTIAPRSRSAVTPDTFVQNYADPRAGANLASISEALGLAAKSAADSAAADQAEKDKEYANNIDYYASEFAADRDIGLVDATQVGSAYPDASPIVAGKIAEAVGSQWANNYVRTKFDEFLQSDANTLDPEARRSFFEQVRTEIADQVNGRPFFGQGAVSAAEGVISQYESQLQQQSAKYHSELQEEQFATEIADALTTDPVSISTPTNNGGRVVAADYNNPDNGFIGQTDPENFKALNQKTQQKTYNLSQMFGKPLRITPHGGKQPDQRSNTSQHHKGTATDIYVKDYSDTEKTKLVALAIANGARGLGSYSAGDGKGTVHIDYRRGGNQFKNEVKGGIALWHRNEPGKDDSWKTAPKWFQEGVKQGVKMLKSGKIPSMDSEQPVALLQMISKAESTGNYNAYWNDPQNSSVKFTNMTLEQVDKWQTDAIALGATSSAVGAYQFTNKTLRRLKKKMNLKSTTKFTPEVQDRMAMELLKERGLEDYQAGRMSAEEFGNELSKEWAGLPMLDGPREGFSYYQGDEAGNRAQISPESFMEILQAPNQRSTDPVSYVDAVASETTSINPIRRREITVDTAISEAVSRRNTAILDRIPKSMATVPSAAEKIANARNKINSLMWQDYTRQNQIQEDNREAEIRSAKQGILERLASGEDIDPAEYVQQGEEVYEFAQQVKDDEFIDPVQSKANLESAREVILRGSTIGLEEMFPGATGRDNWDFLKEQIMESDQMTASDKMELLEDLPTLLEGFNLLNNPKVDSFYNNRISEDVQAYLQSAMGEVSQVMGNNLSGTVRRSFDETLTTLVRANIEDGNGVPRGTALVDILQKAEDSALKTLDRQKQNVQNGGSSGNSGEEEPSGNDTNTSSSPEGEEDLDIPESFPEPENENLTREQVWRVMPEDKKDLWRN